MQEDFIISVVVPVYNEMDVLPEFHLRITTVLDGLPMKSEVVYVNDGSKDDSLSIINGFYEEDVRVAIVDLSRNFGKEIAMTAGIHKAQGDAVVVIDADLQDPPELIPKLIDEWQKGYDVIYAKRARRDGESAFKKLSAHLFYRLMRSIGKIKIPEDTGDYRLLSRRAVDALNTLTEHHRFMKGLFTWIGYRQKAVIYERDARFAGKSKWNYWHLWNFAIEGITSYSSAPLKLASYLGLLTALGAFGFGIFIIIRTLIYGDPVQGYPSMIVIILFLGGVQLMSIGVLGEYIGRIFTETKQRPLYFLNNFSPRKDEFSSAIDSVSKTDNAR
ncbi:Glycosyl transferase, family 2 [hydrothermal vent metagenome]|uniref:Glycosyl transferase, family 2 n=1 Tax=hydrothermal vent metagenome TaxID=652676 RepID=A0A3B1BV85_9ZZZZ